MTETVLKEIVHRAVRDGAFRAQLRTDPASALAGIALTEEERTAFTTGDPARLTALGVDRRMSKAFALGVLGDVSKVIVDDPVASGAFIDEGASAGSVIVGDPLGPAKAPEGFLGEDYFTGPSLGAPAAPSHLQMIEQDLDTDAARRTFLTEDEELFSTRELSGGNAPQNAHLWQIEQDLDTGGSTGDLSVAPIDGSPEQAALDLGRDAPAVDVQITGDDAMPTEY